MKRIGLVLGVVVIFLICVKVNAYSSEKEEWYSLPEEFGRTGGTDFTKIIPNLDPTPPRPPRPSGDDYNPFWPDCPYPTMYHWDPYFGVWVPEFPSSPEFFEEFKSLFPDWFDLISNTPTTQSEQDVDIISSSISNINLEVNSVGPANPQTLEDQLKDNTETEQVNFNFEGATNFLESKQEVTNNQEGGNYNIDLEDTFDNSSGLSFF